MKDFTVKTVVICPEGLDFFFLALVVEFLHHNK